MRNLEVILTAVSLTLCLCVAAWAGVDPSMVLYFDFEDEEGDIVEDRSIYGNEGAIEGNAEWVDGKFGKGLELDGNSFVLVPDRDEFKITDEITLACWAKFESVDGSFNFLICRFTWAGGDNRCYELYLEAGVPAMVTSPDGKGPNTPAVAKESVELDKWYHLAGILDNSGLRIYVNGEEVGVAEPRGDKIFDGEAPITIGDNNSGIAPDFRFVGVIDEVAIYNRALSLAEINQKMALSHAAPVESEGKLTATWGDIKTQY